MQFKDYFNYALDWVKNSNNLNNLNDIVFKLKNTRTFLRYDIGDISITDYKIRDFQHTIVLRIKNENFDEPTYVTIIGVKSPVEDDITFYDFKLVKPKQVTKIIYTT